MTTDTRSYLKKETLRDGEIVTIRAIRPEDKALILESFSEIDERTVYLRFFSNKREFTEKEMKYLTEVDFKDHVALVAIAEIDGKARIVAGGRYVAYDHPGKFRSAEIAFMVHDLYQGRGIGTRIMKHLLAIARGSGIAQFEADVLPENSNAFLILQPRHRAGLS